MRLVRSWALASIVCFAMLGGHARAQSLESVLARMDQSAASFQGLTGKLTKVTHTAVLNSDDTERGSIKMRRSRQREMNLLIDFVEPDAKSVSYRNRKWQIYYPKIKTVQEFDLGKQSNLVDQALLLGFGMTGREIQRQYNVKYLGEEAVGSVNASKLELIPKAADARKHFTKVELWIGPAGHPLQQKVYQPSRDFYRVTYSDVKLNPGLTEEALALNLPKDVKKEYPQR